MTDLKLEVGKKYKIFNNGWTPISDCIYKLVYENEKYYVVEDSSFDMNLLPKDQLGWYEITEHTEESMKEKIKLEVGKKYNIPGKDQHYTFVANLHNFGVDAINPYLFVSEEYGGLDNFDFDQLKGITEHREEPMKKEIKLEVGKKYIIEDEIMLFMGDVNKYTKQHVNNCNLLFLSMEDAEFQKIHWYDYSELEGITEHRELIKNSVEGWFTYNPNRFPESDNLIDALTNLYSGLVLYATKKDCLVGIDLGCGGMYGRFTFEQLPEPEDK